MAGRWFAIDHQHREATRRGTFSAGEPSETGADDGQIVCGLGHGRAVSRGNS
jgi:hypothetical protein